MSESSFPELPSFQLPKDIAAEVARFTEEHETSWIAYRRERHCSPEASGEERETSHSILERLTTLGLSAAIPDRGVGVVGDLYPGDTNCDLPFVAVRADIDALRLTDAKSVSYASVHEGLAHACGHDVHTTIVLGVAEVLAHLKRRGFSLPTTPVRFLFQAAEETCDGANWMIQDGMLDRVNSILGVHVEPNLPVGQIGIRYGVFTAHVDQIRISVKGRGGHTARPHNTTDPIHAAGTLVSSLYERLPRSVDVRDASVFSLGQISGGFASNVIPDEVTLAGTLRTTESTSRDTLIQQIGNICDHVGGLTGNAITPEFAQPLASVVNAPLETAVFEAATRSVLGDAGVELLDRPSMGGEDFAMYMDCCPGSQIRLGCATDLPWPHLHSPVFDVDERAILIGVRVMTHATLMLADRMATDHAAQLGEH